MHPAGRAQGRLVEQHSLPGAQDGAVAPRHGELLVAQHDVPVVRAVGHEEGGEAPVEPLLVLPLRVARVDRRRVERLRRSCRRVLQDASHRRARAPPAPPRNRCAASTAVSILARSASPEGSGWSGSNSPKKVQVHLRRRARSSAAATGSSDRRPHAEERCREGRARRRSAPRRDCADRAAAWRRSRSPRRRRGSHARPTGGRCLAAGSAGSAPPVHRSDGRTTWWSMYCDA